MATLLGVPKWAWCLLIGRADLDGEGSFPYPRSVIWSCFKEAWTHRP